MKAKALFQTLVYKIFYPLYTYLIGAPIVIIAILLKKYKFVGWFNHNWGKGAFACIFQKFEVVGEQHINPQKRYLIVSNHGSSYDIPAILSVIKSPISWVIKDALLKVPVMNILFSLGIGIPIPRSNARESQKRILKRIEVLRQSMNPNIAIFPEGTRSITGELNPFKRGFAKIMKNYQMDILPITLCGFYEFAPRNRFLLNPTSKLKIIVHPPISYEQVKNIDEKLLTKQIEQQIRSVYYP